MSWRDLQLQGLQTRVFRPEHSGRQGLVLMLHGCLQQASAVGDLGNWDQPARQHGITIVAPNVPGGGVISGCWDYYGQDHNRSNRYNGDLLRLTAALLQHDELNIDPRRVYVAGVSSGAGQALVLGCLAPELFAGIGLSAAPALGTGKDDIREVATTVADAVQLSRKLAGDHVGAFSTQVASIIHGEQDEVVHPDYAVLNAQVMAELYQAPAMSEFDPGNLPGASVSGRGRTYQDTEGPRVRLLHMAGLDHAWPAGGAGPRPERFVEPESIHYPADLLSFLENNNRRLPR